MKKKKSEAKSEPKFFIPGLFGGGKIKGKKKETEEESKDKKK